MIDEPEISVEMQAAEVRTVALGLRNQSELPAFIERHEKTGGLERRARVVAALFAAADTLDQIARDDAKR